MIIYDVCAAILVLGFLLFIVIKSIKQELANVENLATRYENFGIAWLESSRYYRDMLHRIAPDHPEVVEDRKFTLLYRDGKIERVSTAELPQLLAESLKSDDTTRT